jgi:hypothetical protein
MGFAIFTPIFLSNFITQLVLYVFFLLGNSPASEFCMPSFRNTLSVPSSQASGYPPAYEDGTDSVPKHRHTKFRRQGITLKEENILHSQHGKNFKSRTISFVPYICKRQTTCLCRIFSVFLLTLLSHSK